MDLEVVLKNKVPNVEEFLKYLQLTIEFEGQLTKRFERYVDEKKEAVYRFEHAISSSFEPYFYLYINTEDA